MLVAKTTVASFLLGTVATCGTSLCVEPAATLIPRAALFGNPDKANAQISPDGKRVAFLAPSGGVMNVWVGPARDIAAAKPVSSDTTRGIRRFQWAFDSKHVLYLQDAGGDENWKVFAVDVTAATFTARDLTPFESITGPDGKPIMLPSGKPMRPAARIDTTSPRFPGQAVLALNNRDPRFHDLYLCDIATGKLTLLLQNDGYSDFGLDDDFGVRYAIKPTPTGANELFVNSGPTRAEAGKAIAPEWKPFTSIGFEDALTTQPSGFDKTGNTLFMIETRGRNTAALTATDLTTGKSSVVVENAKADIGDVMVHPTERTVQAAAFNHLRNEWTVLDKSIQADLDYLKTVSPGEVVVGSRSLDDRNWTVTFALDNGPAKTYLYERSDAGGKNPGKATLLFTNRAALEPLAAKGELTRMHALPITSRDGLELVSYLSLPSWTDTDGDARPSTPLPMVLLVHGGPWARDAWGFNPYHQWLANRGYAVLSVNFRGSTGFGKEFVNAANKEWATKMHDDLLDAVDWAVKSKVADKSKVAIMGGSYGGYATLVGLTFTPDTFACGVDIVGPSNLVTLLNSIPPYWVPLVEQFAGRVGDHRTEEGRKLLTERSPLTHVDKIKRPLLIGQGANDPRVKQAESDQIVSAMQKHQIPVTYVLFPDEGHGFQRPENSKAFNAVVEAFLAEHLGGRVQPIGDDFKGSSIEVPAGAEGVKGLEPALTGTTGK